MFVNFGYVGGESVVWGLSGNIGIFPGVHRLHSLVFRGLSCFIVFYRQPHTHERPPTDTRGLQIESRYVFFTRFRPDVSPM